MHVYLAFLTIYIIKLSCITLCTIPQYKYFLIWPQCCDPLRVSIVKDKGHLDLICGNYGTRITFNFVKIKKKN